MGNTNQNQNPTAPEETKSQEVKNKAAEVEAKAKAEVEDKAKAEVEDKAKAEVEDKELQKLKEENEKLQAALKAKETEQKEQVEKLTDNDVISKYNRFIDLKFIVFDGGVLTEQAEKELEALEEEVKTFKGVKPNDGLFKKGAKGRTCAFGTDLIKLCKGVAVPVQVYNKFKQIIPEDRLSFYFSE